MRVNELGIVLQLLWPLMHDLKIRVLKRYALQAD